MFNLTTTYTNKRTGEPVKPWAWQWQATLRADENTVARFQSEIKRTNLVGAFDVQVIKQFDPETKMMNSVGDLDFTKVRLFSAFSAKNPTNRHDIVVQEGMKPFFLRRTVAMGHLDFAETQLFVIGYKQGKQHHFTYLMPDGRVYHSNQDNIDLVDLGFYPQK